MSISTPDQIDEFDGMPVVATAVKVTNAGDGLSQAQKIEPEKFTMGQKVVLIIECVVTRVAHEPVSKDAPSLLQRTHTLRAGTVAVAASGDPKLKKILDTQAVKIEEAKGIKRLFDADDMDGDDLYGDLVPFPTAGEG